MLSNITKRLPSMFSFKRLSLAVCALLLSGSAVAQEASEASALEDASSWYGITIGQPSDKAKVEQLESTPETVTNGEWYYALVWPNPNGLVSKIEFVTVFEDYDDALSFFEAKQAQLAVRLGSEPVRTLSYDLDSRGTPTSRERNEGKWRGNYWYFTDPRIAESDKQPVMKKSIYGFDWNEVTLEPHSDLQDVLLLLSRNGLFGTKLDRGAAVRMNITGHVTHDPLEYPIEFDVSEYGSCRSFRLADYPSRALREGREGVSSALLTIDAKGYAKSCTVTAGAGHKDLDKATCRIFYCQAQRRAEEGDPLPEGDLERGINWQIP